MHSLHFEKPMRVLGCLLLLVILWTGCSDLEVVENRSEEGEVIERFSRQKSDYARQGLYQKFYPGGAILEQANYENDTLDGERSLFYEDGQVQIVEQYAMGQFAGTYRTYYQNGQLELEGEYIDNAMQGIWKRYHANGELMEEVQFVDNQENGPFVEYHENGKLKTKGNYRDGDNEDGLLEQYDESGELEKKMECRMGVCRTVWTREEGDITPAPFPGEEE